MICKNCRASIENQALFCKYCGVEVLHGNKAPKVKIWIIVLLMLVAIGATIWGLSIFLVNTKTIELNKYITIECSGYNTVGCAEVIFNKDQFLLDYGKKIKFGDNSASQQFSKLYHFMGLSPAEGMLSLFEINLSKNTNLKNGDNIVLLWKCNDEQVETYFNYDVKYQDIEYIVEGLDELEDFNPFDDYEFTFSGYSPQISLECRQKSANEMYNNIGFEVDMPRLLRDNEKLVISMITNNGVDVYEYFARYGLLPEAIEKELTATSDGKYITSASELNGDFLEDLINQSKDKYISYIHNELKNQHILCNIDSIEYIGNLFLQSKEGKENDIQNKLITCFSIMADLTYSDDWFTKTVENIPWYFSVSYDDIVKLNEGTCIADIFDGTFSDNVSLKVDLSGGIYIRNAKFIGLNSYDNIYNTCVSPNLEFYIYEDNLKEYFDSLNAD